MKMGIVKGRKKGRREREFSALEDCRKIIHHIYYNFQHNFKNTILNSLVKFEMHVYRASILEILTRFVVFPRERERKSYKSHRINDSF